MDFKQIYAYLCSFRSDFRSKRQLKLASKGMSCKVRLEVYVDEMASWFQSRQPRIYVQRGRNSDSGAEAISEPSFFDGFSMDFGPRRG